MPCTKTISATAPRRGNIEHLDLDALFSCDVDHVLTMSPPCQPYTRRGKGLASEDPRAQSFLRVIDTIPRMEHPPRWIFVENVVGFQIVEHERETSSGSAKRRAMPLRNLSSVPRHWVYRTRESATTSSRLDVHQASQRLFQAG
jgi:site-specific DNA-cytosine methylase